LKGVQIIEEKAKKGEGSHRFQAQIPCNNGMYMYVCVYVSLFFFELVFSMGAWFFGSNYAP
jgi:hypothetical protein